MHSNCILDSVANLIVRHMVFVGNVQKSPIASHLKGFDPSLYFCCQGPALTRIKEGRLDECLQSRKSCCCLGYPGKNLGF